MESYGIVNDKSNQQASQKKKLDCQQYFSTAKNDNVDNY